MRIVVLGGSGMLGHQMVRRLLSAYPETWWTLRGSPRSAELVPAPWLRGDHAIGDVDAMNLPALESRLRELRPEWVINCLGIIKQRDAAHDAVPSITINSLLPHRIAALLSRWGGRLVHFSTDCVFSGRQGDYTEFDTSDAEDLYGRTKFLGEVSASNALTLRTSIIGRELTRHTSLLDWFLTQRGRTIRGFRRHWWSGTTTLHLADLVVRGIEQWPNLTGLYQVSSGKINKYDLLHLLREGLGVDVRIEPDDGPYCDRSLIGDRFNAATRYQPPAWSTLIAQLAEDSTSYPELGS